MAGVGVGPVCTGAAWGMASISLPLSGGPQRVGDSALQHRSHCESCPEREEVEMRNWFLGVGAKAGALCSGYYRGPGSAQQWLSLCRGSWVPESHLWQECVLVPGEGALGLEIDPMPVIPQGPTQSIVPHLPRWSALLGAANILLKRPRQVVFSLSREAGPPQVCPKSDLACGSEGP